MEYLELKFNGKTYTNQREIIKILKDNQLFWLIDSEVDGAKIEIVNNTVIWNEGIFMAGNWHYGIFRNGGFYGNWQNGIFENGYFGGSWESGVDLTKNN
jgi:hypothetical protein